MITLPYIEVHSQIYLSANSVVYRGVSKEENTPIILKVLKQDYPTPGELTRYKQEYEITRSLNVEGVIKVYSIQEYQRTLVMLLEDFGGESLAKLRSELSGFSPIPLLISCVWRFKSQRYWVIFTAAMSSIRTLTPVISFSTELLGR